MAGALAALWLIRMPARNQAVALPAELLPEAA
jgi:hypothetical protein